MIYMYDSIDPNAIPANAEAVAGYLDGPQSQWPVGAMSRFLTPRKLFITTLPTPDLNADVCDCETFDATPSTAADWARGRVASGRIARIYCNLTTWPQVEALTQGTDVLWWIADPTGVPHMVPGATATQDRWASLDQTGGIANVDISTVDPSFFTGVHMLTQSEKYTWVEMWAYAVKGAGYASEADINAWASKIADDGSNLYELFGEFRSNLIPPVINTRDGWVGPVGTLENQPPVATHTHPVSATISTGKPV